MAIWQYDTMTHQSLARRTVAVVPEITLRGPACLFQCHDLMPGPLSQHRTTSHNSQLSQLKRLLETSWNHEAFWSILKHSEAFWSIQNVNRMLEVKQKTSKTQTGHSSTCAVQPRGARGRASSCLMKILSSQSPCRLAKIDRTGTLECFGFPWCMVLRCFWIPSVTCWSSASPWVCRCLQEGINELCLAKLWSRSLLGVNAGVWHSIRNMPEQNMPEQFQNMPEQLEIMWHHGQKTRPRHVLLIDMARVRRVRPVLFWWYSTSCESAKLTVSAGQGHEKNAASYPNSAQFSPGWNTSCHFYIFLLKKYETVPPFKRFQEIKFRNSVLFVQSKFR